jgi:hypothetical protein
MNLQAKIKKLKRIITDLKTLRENQKDGAIKWGYCELISDINIIIATLELEIINRDCASVFNSKRERMK